MEFDVLANDIDETIKGLGLDVIRPQGVTKLFEEGIEDLKKVYMTEEKQ